jgi:hypothetical protein
MQDKWTICDVAGIKQPRKCCGEAKVGSKRNSDHGTREYQAMRMAIQCKIKKE